MRDITGTDIAGYRLLEPLGSGSISTAWLAKSLVDERDVALKLLHEPSHVETLKREFELLSGIVHPHLAQLEDFGFTNDNKAFYTSRLVLGRNLARFATESDWSAIRSVLVDLLRGLGFLHSLGLRHGDVKPDNVLVEQGRGVLIDLSCAARITESQLAEVSGTEVSGTPAYWAPELLQRTGRIDARADLFALGVLINELASLAGPPPTELSELATRLRQDVARRPTSAEELLEALGERNPYLMASAVPPRLVGRDAAMERAGELLNAFVTDSPRSRSQVLFCGPPGVGHTRLLQELKWMAQRVAPTVFIDGRRSGQLQKCLELRKLDPFGPLTGTEQQVWVVDNAAEMKGRELVALDALVEVTASPVSPVFLIASEAHVGSRKVAAGVPQHVDVVTKLPGAMPLLPLSLSHTGDFVGPERAHLAPTIHRRSGGLPKRIARILRRLGTGTTAVAAEEAADAVLSSSEPLNDDERSKESLNNESLSKARLSPVLIPLSTAERALLAAVAVSDEWELQPQELRTATALLEVGLLLRSRDALVVPEEERPELLGSFSEGERRDAHQAAADRARHPADRVRHLARAQLTQEARAGVAQAVIRPGHRWRRAAVALAPFAPSDAARIYEVCGCPSQAVELLHGCEDFDDRVRYAACLLRLGETQTCLEVLAAARALADTPDEHARVADQRARALIRQGQYAEARELAESQLASLHNPMLCAVLHESVRCGGKLRR